MSECKVCGRLVCIHDPVLRGVAYAWTSPIWLGSLLAGPLVAIPIIGMGLGLEALARSQKKKFEQEQEREPEPEPIPKKKKKKRKF